jgi:archaellum component FlaC
MEKYQEIVFMLLPNDMDLSFENAKKSIEDKIEYIEHLEKKIKNQELANNVIFFYNHFIRIFF